MKVMNMNVRFKKEVKCHMFQINDNNRKVLFNTQHVPIMIALSLMVKN